ncbi:MAG: MATE family efflux transporter [Olegusella sp.]|nr:MATE family efflux transporter [Olegusella sp.]
MHREDKQDTDPVMHRQGDPTARPGKGSAAQVDMTQGSLWDKILLFAIPVAVTAILQQLYNTADIAVAGRMVGTNAEAGIGNNAPVIALIVSLFQGISLGANVTIATAIGAEEHKHVHDAVHTAFLFSLVAGVVFALLTQVFVAPLMAALGVPAEVMPDAISYLRIYLLGLPVIFLYDFEAAILRSVGDTWSPLRALAVSSALNLALDLLAAGPLAMGTAGLAVATVIGNAVAAAILMHHLMHKDTDIRLDLRELRFDRWALRRIISIGLPAGIQGSLFSVANIVIQGAVNSFGSTVIAGGSASASLEAIDYYIINAFGQAATTFIGQNNGAGKQDRCNRTLRLTLTECFLVCGSIIVSIIVFGRSLIGIFNPDPAVIDAGYIRVCFIVGAHFFSILIENFSGYLRGYGISLPPAVWTFFSIVVVRLAYVWLFFPAHHTYEVLLAVYPITLGLNALGLVVLAARARARLRVKEKSATA